MKNFERDNSLDLVKWIALLAMIIDHIWFLLPAETQEITRWMRVFGRLAFPLFSLAIATNVTRQPAGYPGGWKYLGGLLLFALLSQWSYSSYFENGRLNILFTLVLGLVVAQAAHHRMPRLIAAGVVALVIALTYRPLLSYGMTGVLLPGALLFALQARRPETMVASWSIAALLAATANAGGSILLLSDLSDGDQAAIATAALAPVFGLALLRIQVRPLRPVGTWMYPLYPIHLLLLSSLSIAF
jgi:hypothetical protein